jgi:hypothetical protein
LFHSVDVPVASELSHQIRSSALMQNLKSLLETSQQRLGELSGESRAQATQLLQQVEQTVKFLDVLNNFTGYMQIPLMFSQERTTAELYVFRDSQKKRGSDPENVTMFLSLDTKALGKVETFVKLIGKNVECDFSLSNEETCKSFAAAMTLLAQSLEAQSYHLARTSTSVTPNRRNAIDITMDHDVLLSKYSFNRMV